MATKVLVRNTVALQYGFEDENAKDGYRFVSKSYNLRASATVNEAEAFVNAISPLCEYEFDRAFVNEKHEIR